MLRHKFHLSQPFCLHANCDVLRYKQIAVASRTLQACTICQGVHAKACLPRRVFGFSVEFVEFVLVAGGGKDALLGRGFELSVQRIP